MALPDAILHAIIEDEQLCDVAEEFGLVGTFLTSQDCVDKLGVYVVPSWDQLEEGTIVYRLADIVIAIARAIL